MDNALKRLILNKVLPLFLIAFVIVFIYFYHDDTKNMSNILSHVIDEKPIKFNYDSGFYDKSINLELKLDSAFPLGAKIYYTLNGNDPNNTSLEYKDKIELKLEEKMKVYPIKAIAYYNGEYSGIYSKTYIIDKNINNRFDLDVIIITSDEKNLYDYEKGIMVPGITYDTNKNTSNNKNYIRGNYNNRGEDWVRDAHITFFEKNGELAFDHDIGISISGNTSAQNKVKSLKLIANYKDDYQFEYDLLNDEEVSSVSHTNKYNNLRLSTNGQDYKNGNINSSIASTLAMQSNFYNVSIGNNRVVVFLNDSFYGILTLQESNSSTNILKRFGLNNENGVVYKWKGSENSVFSNSSTLYLFEADLNDEKNQINLEKYFDIDELLLYYSLELLMNNWDWPKTNFGIWRYWSKDSIDVKKYYDRRFHPFLFDADMIFTSPNSSYFKDKWNIFIKENDSIFIKLMSYKIYRDKFITIICDLLNTSFKKENIYSIIDNEYKLIQTEYVNSNYTEINDSMENNIRMKKEGVDYVLDNLLLNISNYFKLSDMYELNLKVNDGIKVLWNNMELYENSIYSNKYFADVNFEINYEESPGYLFDYWLVNDKKITDKVLTIDKSMIKNNKIIIEAYSKKDESVKLIISEVSAKDDSDWIKLINIGEDINLKDYSLSDRTVKKYNLPNIVLKNNESIIINGNKNYYSIGNYICNFNLSSGETLTLFYKDKVIDKLYIPKMSSIETYGRYLNSNTYKFFENKDNKRKVSTY